MTDPIFQLNDCFKVSLQKWKPRSRQNFLNDMPVLFDIAKRVIKPNSHSMTHFDSCSMTHLDSCSPPYGIPAAGLGQTMRLASSLNIAILSYNHRNLF